MNPEAAAPELLPEDEARAAIYGLVARLFYAAPDAGVIGQILHANAFEAGSERLALAWRELAAACRSAFPVVLENEHTELFIGTGRAEVTPYLTHYMIQHASDNPLVELRGQLAAWGIARQEGANEPEDHIAGICEGMRMAIAVQHRTLTEQRMFFERFLYRGAIAFCDAVSASAKADFYRRVANFVRVFLELEREAFEML
ncbi:MAG: molecular chaperone TorD family protein [Betaproteobacteria bacterium]|nr:molecular chaperone TorD family protein [Betaproteobacteria bacterium]